MRAPPTFTSPPTALHTHRTAPHPAAAGASPAIVRQLVPLLEQLTPIYLDISQGTQEFVPPPEDSRAIIRQGGWGWE